MTDIFYSTSIEGGHSWTITTKLGHILKLAEEKYGQRDKSYTILGVEYNNIDHPQIWYPGNCKHIAIQITTWCINDMNRAVFQVAHEAIHCLSPLGGQITNVLEEGLASYFSIVYTKDNGHGTWSYLDTPSYQEALKLVEQLLHLDCDIIKKVREVQPTIGLITKEDLLSINSHIPDALASRLTNKFVGAI